MIRFRLTEPPSPFRNPPQAPGQVEVLLPANDLNEVALFEAVGDPRLVERVRGLLLSCYGYGGHGIEEHTTPLDLGIAMKSQNLWLFRPELVEGAEVLSEGAGWTETEWRGGGAGGGGVYSPRGGGGGGGGGGRGRAPGPPPRRRGGGAL